jgi:hypothetical protein
MCTVNAQQNFARPRQAGPAYLKFVDQLFFYRPAEPLLCERMLSLAAISVALSPHPKIPFLADKAQRLTPALVAWVANLRYLEASVSLPSLVVGLIRLSPRRHRRV